LKAKVGNTNSVMGRAKSVLVGITTHAQFASLASNAAAIEDQITVVDDAETLAGTGAKGTARARNGQRKILMGMLKIVLPLVQAIADQCATMDAAIAAIEESGFVVAIVTRRIKPILAAKQSQAGAPVVLVANATALGAIRTRKNFFNWQFSVDGGLTWVTVPSTPKSKTSIANLTPLTHYSFRVSLTDSSGVMGEWSPVVGLLVH
jgi:hypothetical protein